MKGYKEVILKLNRNDFDAYQDLIIRTDLSPEDIFLMGIRRGLYEDAIYKAAIHSKNNDEVFEFVRDHVNGIYESLGITGNGEN